MARLVAAVAALLFQMTAAAAGAPVSVSGTVLGPNGPLAGALVHLLVRESAAVNTVLADVHLTTAADGSFTQSLPPGHGTFDFTAGGSSGLSPRFVVVNFDGPVVLRVRLLRSVTIAGHATFPAGASGTRVARMFNLANDENYRFEVGTDGTFNAGVPAGRYSVQALVEPQCIQEKSHNCHGPYFSRVNVDASGGDVRNLVLPSPVLDAAILPDRAPIASRIAIGAADADGLAMVSGSAGAAEGLSTVLVANLQTQQFNVGVSAPDGSFAVPIFAPQGSMIHIKHDPTGRYLTRTAIGTGNNDGFEVAPGTVIHVPVPAGGTAVPFSTSSLVSLTGEAGVSLNTFDILGARDITRWSAAGTLDSTTWQPGSTQTLRGTITIHSKNLSAIADLSTVRPNLTMTLERLFDGNGRQRQLHHQFMSSLLTPTGFPIERLTPILGQTLITVPTLTRQSDARASSSWQLDYRVPADLPAGIYRPSLAAFVPGLDMTPRYFDIFPSSEGSDYFGGELPLVRVGAPAPARLFWVLGMNEFSNGTRGTVAIEERDQFRTALHVITPTDAVIWPRFDPLTHQPKVYRLEPFVPMLSFAHARLPNPPRFALALPGGALHVRVLRPDGAIDDLGTAPFAQMRNGSPMSRAGVSMSGASVHSTDFMQLTTLDPRFDYVFKVDGRHRIEMTGHVTDVWGNTYEGGGTYEVIVARPLVIEPGVMTGTPFEVGDRINTAMNVTPAVAAEITLRYLLVNARGERRTVDRFGMANRFGHWSAGEPIVASEDGEYRIDVLATYVDERGDWWAGATTWGSIIESATTSLRAHGRRGWHRGISTQPAWFNVNEYRAGDGHVMYPFHIGDVKWMDKHDSAATIPKITVQDSVGTLTARLRPRAASASLEQPQFDVRAVDGELPLFISSPTPYSPSTHPDLADQWGYFYAFAERPAVHVRSIVSEDDGDNGYWRFNESYQNQIGAGLNGDLPNDFKFLFGGAVYRDRDFSYFGAYASLFVLVFDRDKPFDGRIFPPFQGKGGGPSGGPLFVLKGKDIEAFFHLTAVRPGTILHTGAIASFAGQIAPTLASKVEIVVTSPSGLTRTISGQANKVGYFYDPRNDFVVAEAGVWKAKVKVWHDGAVSAGQVQPPYPEGNVLGSREGELFFYVVDWKTEPLQIATMPARVRPADGPITFTVTPPGGLHDVQLTYTATMPGFILEEGITTSGRYVYDAQKLALDFPNLDLYDADGFAGVDIINISLVMSGTDDAGKRHHLARQIVIEGEVLLAPDQKPASRRRSVRR